MPKATPALSEERQQALDALRASIRENERDYHEHFLKVKHKSNLVTDFTLNVPQRFLEKLYEIQIAMSLPLRWALIKYRQLGSTKYFNGKVHTRAISRPGHTAVITAHRKKRAQQNLRLQKQHLNDLPEEIRPHLAADNTEELYLDELDVTITCLAASDPEAVRGDTINTWLGTEWTFWGVKGASFNQIFDAGMQAVPDLPDTMVVFEATANGQADESYDFYQGAKNGVNGFTPIFLCWFHDPNYERPFHKHPEARSWAEARYLRDKCTDCNRARWEWAKMFLTDKLRDRKERYNLTWEQIHWYWHDLNQRLRGDELKMMQEYPCSDTEAFIASGTPLFDGDLISRVSDICRLGKLFDLPTGSESFEELMPNPELIRDKQPYLEIWLRPRGDKQYVIPADCSMGQAHSHPSAFYVVEVESQEVAAAVHGRIEPEPYAEIIARVGTIYNTAIAAPEREYMGTAVIQRLQQLNYPNLHQSFKLTPKGWEETQVMGFTTNAQSRPLFIAAGRKPFNSHKGNPEYLARMVKDKMLLGELSRFTSDNLAKKGQHADRAIAWMIGQLICHQEKGIEVTEADPNAEIERAAAAQAKRRTQRPKVQNETYSEFMANRKAFMKAQAMPYAESGDYAAYGDEDDDEDYKILE